MLQPSPRKQTAWTAVGRVITDPAETFTDLGERPAILPGYLLLTIAGLIGFYLMMPLIEAASAQQLAQLQAQRPDIPADQLTLGKTMGFVTLGITSLASPWLAGLIAALIAAFFGQFHGGSAGFGAYFGMIGYARVPLALGGLIQSAMLTRVATMQQAQSMSLSPAVFLGADASPYLKALLGTINPFDIWYYALLAIGFGVLHRGKAEKGITFAAVIYLLNLVIVLVGAAVTGMAAGMQ